MLSRPASLAIALVGRVPGHWLRSKRFDKLSSREREVMLHVVAGRLNKQIANDIGIAESTVKVHRTNLMRKMKARSLPELSRMADTLNMRLQQPQNS
jgi:FixJ family two-component response regulator